MFEGVVDDDQGVWFVAFHLGPSRFGLAADSVDQVVPISALVELPDNPPWLLGALVLSGGETVPVIDVVRLLRLDVPDPDLDSRIIIARRSGEQIGLLIRSDVQILELPATALRPPGDVEAHARGLRAIAQTAGGPMLIIDLDGVGALPAEHVAVS